MWAGGFALGRPECAAPILSQAFSTRSIWTDKAEASRLVLLPKRLGWGWGWGASFFSE